MRDSRRAVTERMERRDILEKFGGRGSNEPYLLILYRDEEEELFKKDILVCERWPGKMVSPMKAKYRRRSGFPRENADFHFENGEFEEVGRQVAMHRQLLREQSQSPETKWGGKSRVCRW